MMSSEPPTKSTAREYFESIIIAVILALFVRTWVVQAFKIPTGSMEQNLLIGDHLLVNKFVFGPAVWEFERAVLPIGRVERGDILVFKYPEEPGRDFIKRVIGLPGETLEVRDKRVHINGAPLDEPYLQPMRSPGPGALVLDRRDNFGPVSIPPDHYFMMGDNRDNSEDSRFWGALPHANVKGKAMVIYWSHAESQAIVPQSGFVGAVRRVGSVVLNFFTETRWSRTLRQIG